MLIIKCLILKVKNLTLLSQKKKKKKAEILTAVAVMRHSATMG